MAILLSACTGNRTADTYNEVIHRGDTVYIDRNSPIWEYLEFRTVKEEEYSAAFRTVGEVSPVAGRIAEISAPFAGRITECNIHLGQKVREGSPVFGLGSSDFYEAGKAYFAARSNHTLAAKRYARQKELSANGVGTEKELEQAGNEAYIAEQELEQAAAVLGIFNADTSSVRTGRPLSVVSPINGEVLKCDMTIGSYVGEGEGPLAVIADLSEVWVRAFIKERYFGSVKEGDRAEIHIPSIPGKTYSGKIRYVGEIVDPSSRSLEVIIDCDNMDRDLKLGMFCNVTFFGTPSESIILPATALMQERESDFVYLLLPDSSLLRRNVVSENTGNGSVRITEGLSCGETAMTKGGIFLNM